MREKQVIEQAFKQFVAGTAVMVPPNGVQIGQIEDSILSGAHIFFIDGQIEKAFARIFWSSGKVFAEIYYKDGLRNGPAKFFKSGGGLIWECDHLNDEKHGLQYYYADDGIFVSRYENGLQVGPSWKKK